MVSHFIRLFLAPFIDQYINPQQIKEEYFFSVLPILVACLGFLSLKAYNYFPKLTEKVENLLFLPLQIERQLENMVNNLQKPWPGRLIPPSFVGGD